MESAPVREAKRAAKRILSSQRTFLRDPFTHARDVYDFVCAAATLPPPERLVCERCGLVQENHRGKVLDDGRVIVSPCKGFEGIGCGSLHAVTLESYDWPGATAFFRPVA